MNKMNRITGAAGADAKARESDQIKGDQTESNQILGSKNGNRSCHFPCPAFNSVH